MANRRVEITKCEITKNQFGRPLDDDRTGRRVSTFASVCCVCACHSVIVHVHCACVHAFRYCYHLPGTSARSHVFITTILRVFHVQSVATAVAVAASGHASITANNAFICKMHARVHSAPGAANARRAGDRNRCTDLTSIPDRAQSFFYFHLSSSTRRVGPRARTAYHIYIYIFSFVPLPFLADLILFFTAFPLADHHHTVLYCTRGVCLLPQRDTCQTTV